jgi:LemA protein
MKTILIIVFFLVIIISLLYKILKTKKNRVDNIYRYVNKQLKRRCDLIPSLITIYKEYSNSEEELLENITYIRSNSIKHHLSDTNTISLDSKLTSELNTLKNKINSSSELKNNENITNIKFLLDEIEKQISTSRKSYNNVVNDYNKYIETIPAKFIAIIMSYKKRDVFKRV